MHRLRFKKHRERCRLTDSGVSEIISVILLISLVVAGAAIIATQLLSTPPPEKIPRVDIQMSVSSDQTKANFANMGGDVLEFYHTYIREITSDGNHKEYGFINKNNTITLISNSSSRGNWTNISPDWIYGSSAQIEYISTDNNPYTTAYQIIYKGGQGEYLLKEFNRANFWKDSESKVTQSNCSLDSEFTYVYGNDINFNYIKLDPGSYSVTVQFTATNQTYRTSDGYQEGWIFSDGGESSDTNTLHTFTIPNNDNSSYTYTVTHWVANNAVYGCSNSITKSFTIYPNNPSTCGSIDLDFTTTLSCRHASFSGYTTASPFSWNYTISGNGVSEDLDGQNVSYDFLMDGSYDVMIGVLYDDDCYIPTFTTTLHTIDVDCCQLVASFTATESPGNSGNFTFTDTSTIGNGNITGWNWDFGDGTTSTEKNPSHQFTTCGTKTVTLTVTANDTACKSDSITKEITVSTIPITAAFTSTRDSTNYFSYTFTNTSVSASNITSWIWKFSDDGSTGSENSVSHLFTNEGYYLVSLTVTNDCGVTDTIIKTIHVVQYCPDSTITASAGTGGTITPAGIATVTCGTTRTYTITPASCYQIQDIFVDEVSQGPINTYTFTNVLANHTISATFTSETYAITSSAETGGIITPAGITNVPCGGNQAYTISNLSCYTIQNVLVDGVSQGPITTYSFTNVTTNHAISATFTSDTYAINSSAGTGGTITLAGSTSVNCGADQTYTIIPATCYQIQDVFVDGVSLGPINTYTFTNVTANHTISVTFTSDTYAINSSAGTGGTITPAGSTSVNCGADQTYTIIPATCYQIQDIFVDGVLQGPSTTYSFINVTANHTISATFTSDTYAITSNTGTGGTITPAGSTNVPCGGTQTYTISNLSCYTIQDVLIDGLSQGPINTYTFTNVTANHTINATFTSDTYAITSSAGTGGTITPTGSTSITCGGTQTYTITPAICYQIQDIFVDGVSQGPSTTYSFTNVTANHTINATFTSDTYAITSSAGTGGTITPIGSTSITCGGTQTYTITPANCYQILDIFVDGVPQGPSTTYSFTNVTANHTISASFTYKIYAIISMATTGGTINPVGFINIPCGETQTYTITPLSGYTIQDVAVNSVSVGNISTYTFSNVQQNHTILANFTKNQTNYIDGIFVYGSTLSFGGSSITGPGATTAITGGLVTSDLNGGASIDVTNIYVGGNVNLDGGSAGLGSSTQPGNIYVNGNLRLWRGAREIYGDVYVNGNFDLKDARIHGNVYVNGNLTLDYTPWLADDAYIYYTGTITYPQYYNHPEIISKCINQISVPGFEPLTMNLTTKSADWYTAHGYVSGGSLTDNMKIFADSYSSTGWQNSVSNLTVVARNGDITITGLGSSGVTGVFFAPYGKVTFNGGFIKGIVIARDGFFVTSGGTAVTFLNINHFIGDPDDYPF